MIFCFFLMERLKLEVFRSATDRQITFTQTGIILAACTIVVATWVLNPPVVVILANISVSQAESLVFTEKP